MLTEIRDRSSGAFAYFIAALIIVPMAFWGVNEYANPQVVPTVLEVGDIKITKQELDQRLSQAQDAERQRNPELGESDFFNSDFFKRSVLNSLIDRALIEQIAVDNNYRVGNTELAALIRKEELFQTETGEFNQAAYDDFVQSRLYSKQRFEQQVRDDSRTTKVTQGYQSSAVVMPNEVRLLLELQAERRTFDLVTISEADYRESVEVSDSDVEEYYQANLNSFMNPDRVSVEYVELDANVIAENIEISEDELQQQYEDNKDNFFSPESRSARHILLSTNGDKGEEAQMAQAQLLLEQLRNGGDFAELAKEFSDDTGSGAIGGDLGKIERGQMVEEFEQSAFALDVGEISEPIKTQFGYHIIEVTDISGGEPQAFAEVRFEIEEQLRESEALSLFSGQLLELRNLVFESENSLTPVAEELGLTVLSTDFFTREAGEGIAANAVVRSAAFDVTVLEDGLNSDPVEVSEGYYVALRKIDFKPAAPKELAEVSEQIKASLINQGAELAAQAAVDTLQTKAQESWDQVLADPELSSIQHTVSLIDPALPVASDIVQKVSAMRLNGNEPAIETLRSNNGDFHLIRLTKVRPGDLRQVSDEIKEATRSLVAQRNGNSLFSSYLYQLNQDVAKNINEDLL